MSDVLLMDKCTWLAVKGKSSEAILQELGLRAGMASTRHRYSPIEGAKSDHGWYLIVADGRDHRLIQEPVLTRLSAGCDVLTCTVDEASLFSAAIGWRDGRRVWSAVYDGEENPGPVVVEGELPHNFAFVRQNLTEQSKAEDAGDLLLDPLFEIPIEFVRLEVLYRPDQPSPAYAGRFVMLQATDPTILQRLFGG